MKTEDPKLLAHEGGSEFERRWLSAARAEEPPPAVVRRIELALGIAPAVPAAPAEPAAGGGAAVAKSGLSALRIAGLSALGVGGAVGLVLFLTRPAPPPAPAPPASAATPAEPAETQPGASAGEPGALGDEIALIDGARAALSSGSPAQALSLLETYRARHPRGMLLPEALAMRVEAIDRTGDHARARALARAFLAEYPQSPLAQRLAGLAAPASK